MNSLMFMHGKWHIQADPYSVRIALSKMQCTYMCVCAVCVSLVGHESQAVHLISQRKELTESLFNGDNRSEHYPGPMSKLHLYLTDQTDAVLLSQMFRSYSSPFIGQN